MAIRQSASDYDSTVLAMVEAGRKAALDEWEKLKKAGGSIVTILSAKDAYDGTKAGDVVTTLDKASQAACDLVRRSRMPLSGALGEEDGLFIPCTIPGKTANFAYWTIDGGDGTRRLVRRLQEGKEPDSFYVMAALVMNGAIVVAAVQEIFGTHLVVLRGNGKVQSFVHRKGKSLMALSRPTLLTQGRVVVRTPENKVKDRFPPVIQRLLNNFGADQRLYTPDVSIAQSSSWLWDESAALPAVLHVQAPGTNTGWDNTPIQGINQALDMVYLQSNNEGTALKEHNPTLYALPVRRTHSLVVIHRSRLDQLAKLVPLQRLS